MWRHQRSANMIKPFLLRVPHYDHIKETIPEVKYRYLNCMKRHGSTSKRQQAWMQSVSLLRLTVDAAKLSLHLESFVGPTNKIFGWDF